jgi:hypothetical protein
LHEIAEVLGVRLEELRDGVGRDVQDTFPPAMAHSSTASG